MQTTRTTTSNMAGYGFPSDDQMESIALAQFKEVSNTAFDFKYAALFTRINYNWDQKYILNLQARRDGSSRFAPGSQYGNFWIDRRLLDRYGRRNGCKKYCLPGSASSSSGQAMALREAIISVIMNTCRDIQPLNPADSSPCIPTMMFNLT